MDATSKKALGSGKVKGKSIVPFDIISRNAETVTDPGDIFKSSLLLRSGLWEKRQWQDSVLQKSAQGRFLRPLYARISTSYARVATG